MKKLGLGIVIVCILAFISMFIGYSNVTPAKLLAGDAKSWLYLVETRLPRTVAILLVGMSLALCGMIMQLLVRNRFVEPSTAGTTESASLGLLLVAMFAPPDLPVIGRTAVAACFAFAGSLLFIFILQRIRLRSVLIVPLTGIMLGYVIGALANGIADRETLLPSLQAYMFGSFSMVIKGNYELLWLSLPLCIAAYLAADRFTVAGLGETFTTNLGLNYRHVMLIGLIIISLITGLVVTSVGRIPFVGLVVPNIVAIVMGDNMRRTAPYVALTGAALVLICDILGRLPSNGNELPVGTMMGVVGSFIFIALLLRWRKRLG